MCLQIFKGHYVLQGVDHIWNFKSLIPTLLFIMAIKPISEVYHLIVLLDGLDASYLT